MFFVPCSGCMFVCKYIHITTIYRKTNKLTFANEFTNIFISLET